MIVNWKKPGAGALVLPCMKDGLVLKKITLVPGNNDIDTEDWLMARSSCKRHIDRGLIEALENIEVVKPVKEEKVVEGNDMIPSVDELTVDNIPMKEMAAWMKSEDLYEEVALKKKADQGQKALSKVWFVPYLKENPELWEQYLEACGLGEGGEKEESSDDDPDDDPEIITAIELGDMDINEATAVITETYNLETLEKWKSETGVESLRMEIMNQIELVNKPPEGNQSGDTK